MQLERIECKLLERAKSVCVSPNYIVGCTGKRAMIMDSQGALLHTVEGLEYVYVAQVSPDETKLLLVSNANKFYIVDLQTFEKRRVSVKAPYNHNLEGRGCWSLDGSAVWIPVQRATGYITSTLRRYYIEDPGRFEDYLADQYYLSGIWPMESMGAYLLTGYNRRENNRDYFIYFDGSAFQELPLETRMVAPAVTVDARRGVITVSSVTGCRQFSLEGQQLREILPPEPQETVFRGEDTINKYAMSACGKFMFLACQSGFYLLDASTGAVLASVPEKYGVEDVVQTAPDVIALTTWTGVTLYRLCEC